MLLHVALLGFAARAPRSRPTLAERSEPAKSQAEVEVVVDALPLEQTAAAVPQQASAEPGRARAGAGARSTAMLAAPEAEADAAPGGAGEPAVEDPPGPPSTAPSAAAPHLSLSALGVDGNNPFLDRPEPGAARAAKAARLKRRLDRSLAQGLVNRDVELGLGSSGPVLRALEAATYASAAPVNGSASFILVIDSEGKLVSGVLANASGDREAWARVARQAVQALAQRKLKVPRGKSVQLSVEVTSHLELPSGADPDVELSFQGAPLKKGGGPRSTKLDITLFPFPTATVYGDPADIGARPRRMVRAHVVSEELM